MVRSRTGLRDEVGVRSWVDRTAVILLDTVIVSLTEYSRKRRRGQLGWSMWRNQANMRLTAMCVRAIVPASEREPNTAR